MSDRIYYKSGYKYQLASDYVIDTGILPSKEVTHEYFSYLKSGILCIKKGYAWNGASGPAIDTNNFMRGSLVHDCFYQMMREWHLPRDYFEQSNRLLQKICIEDGMSKIRAWWVYRGVSIGGYSATDPKNDKPVLEAP